MHQGLDSFSASALLLHAVHKDSGVLCIEVSLVIASQDQGSRSRSHLTRMKEKNPYSSGESMSDKLRFQEEGMKVEDGFGGFNAIRPMHVKVIQ